MVALVNHGKTAHNITVEWKTLGFDDGQKAVVVDVWDAQRAVVRESATVSYTSRVPSHGSAVVRITRVL